MKNDNKIEEQVLSLFNGTSKFFYIYNFVLLGVSYLTFDQFKSNYTQCLKCYLTPVNILLIMILSIWHDRLDILIFMNKHQKINYKIHLYINENQIFLRKIAEYRKSRDCLDFLKYQRHEFRN